MKAKSKTLKRILSITLCLMMILGNIAVGGDGFASLFGTFAVKAAEEECTYTYDSNTNTLKISGNGPMDDYSLTQRPWNEYANSVQSVIIENGVTSIGSYSFIDFSSLQSIRIPKSVTSVDANAFERCNVSTVYYGGTATDKAAITISETNNGALSYATWFYGYEEECTCTFDSKTGTLTITGKGPMYNYGNTPCPWSQYANSTANIVIKSGVTSIGSYAFADFRSVQSITIPKTLKAVDDYAFHNCSIYGVTYEGNAEDRALITVGEMENGILDYVEWTYNYIYTEASTYSFNSETGVLTISGLGPMTDYSMTAYPWNEYRDTATAVIIESGITSITPYAFCDFNALKSIVIPATVTSIEECAFAHDYNLSTVYYAGSPADKASITIDETENETLSYDATWLYYYVPSVEITCTFDEEAGILYVYGAGLMEDSVDLEKELPWGKYTEKITGIVIADGIISICSYAFAQCNSLKSIILPKTITRIAEDAFFSSNVVTVNYKGTEADKAYITIDEMGNECLTYATWKYNYVDRIIPTYTYDEATHILTISGNGMMCDYTQPSDMHANAPWGEYNDEVKSIVINEGITGIGTYAFYGLHQVTDITLPTSLTTIGEGAFMNCRSLNNLTIPQSVTEIQNQAFACCPELTVNIYNTVTSIGKEAFLDAVCVNFAGTAETWENIGGVDSNPNLVEYCDNGTLGENLNWVVFDSTLVLSGTGEMPSFSATPVIERINSTKHNCIGDTPAVTSDPVRPWDSHSSSIKKVIVTGFTNISDFAFSCMTAVTEYDISESVTSYGKYAFFANTALATFTMKNTVVSVGYRAFNDCTALGSVTFSNTLQKIGAGAFCHCKLANVQIPDTVTDIGSATFRLNEWSLLSIKFPKNMKTIKTGMCQECYNLNSVTLPEDLEVIENNAFLFARFYSGSLNFPSTLKYIGDHAFRYSYGLSEITIPANVTHIGFQAFRLAGRDVTALSVKILSTGNLDWSNSFVDCAKLKTLTLTEGLTSIGSSVFSGCTGLTSVTVPSTVTSIGSGAFNGCTALASINIPTGVTSIGANAFKGCAAITSITLPDGITAVNEATFSGCTTLASINIPTGVTSIGKNAFNGCTALTSLTLHNGITSFGTDAFSGVTNAITYKGTFVELIQTPGYSTCGSTNFTCSNGNGTIQYGSYPQGKVSNSTLIAALNNLTPDSFGDVEYEGEKYRLYNNTYFKYEPITWEVLDTTTGLIISKKILTYVTYTQIQNGWLNTDFYAVAFSDAEKSMVIKNGNNYAKLLTLSDVTNSAYGYNSKASAQDGKRQKSNTAYAGYLADKYTGKYWWLDSGKAVDAFGYSGFKEEASSKLGIVPAMNISFENCYAIAGNSAQGFEVGDTYSTNTITVIHNYLKNCKIVSETLSAIETSTPANGYVFTQDDYTAGKKTFTLTCGGQTCTVDIFANRHVTFNANGRGTAPESQTILYGEMATKPSYSKVVDYVIDYWYLDGSESTAFNFANPITEDTVLYAKWVACTHNWESWVVVENPTATKTGLMRRICSDCGQVEEMIIPVLQPDYPTSVTLDKSKITLSLGETETLTATVKPDTATDKSVIWSTSDSSVVTVSDGVITPVGAGYASITVSTVDDRYAVCQATCLVHIISVDLSLSSANVNLESGIISGIAPKLDSLSKYVTLADGCSFEYSTATIGTGTKINVVKNGEIVDTYTAMLFGDVNGDGIYDGMDSIIVSCLANGMLTREQVGEAVWMASDCNHDGVIDNLDVEILNNAGLLLAQVDQSANEKELEANSTYQEYLNLIDQSPEKDEEPTEETEKSLFAIIISVLVELFNYLTSIINKAV